MRQTERRIVGRGVDWLGRDHRRWVVPVTGIGVAAHAEKTRVGGGGGQRWRCRAPVQFPGPVPDLDDVCVREGREEIKRETVNDG